MAAKFCQDMENVPIGVIIGLFAAISHQLPAFTEWDTEKHHRLLNSNEAVCDAMTEVRENVTLHGGFSSFALNRNIYSWRDQRSIFDLERTPHLTGMISTPYQINSFPDL